MKMITSTIGITIFNVLFALNWFSHCFGDHFHGIVSHLSLFKRSIGEYDHGSFCAYWRGVYGVLLWCYLSVAVAVGFIALFGMAIETVMILTIYLNEAMQKLVKDKGNSKETILPGDIRNYIIDGATKRLRPVVMTVSVSLFGLIPILWATGTGSDVMLPITIPLIGGTITAIIYVLFVTPVVFEIVKENELKHKGKIKLIDVKE